MKWSFTSFHETTNEKKLLSVTIGHLHQGNSTVLVEFSAVLIKNSTVLAENTSSRLSFPHTNFMS